MTFHIKSSGVNARCCSSGRGTHGHISVPGGGAEKGEGQMMIDKSWRMSDEEKS